MRFTACPSLRSGGTATHSKVLPPYKQPLSLLHQPKRQLQPQLVLLSVLVRLSIKMCLESKRPSPSSSSAARRMLSFQGKRARKYFDSADFVLSGQKQAPHPRLVAADDSCVAPSQKCLGRSPLAMSAPPRMQPERSIPNPPPLPVKVPVPPPLPTNIPVPPPLPQTTNIDIQKSIPAPPPMPRRRGLVAPRHRTLAVRMPPVFDSFDCPICMDEVEHEDECARLNCGHRYCRDCFSMHVTALLDSNRSGDYAVPCPHPGCNGDLSRTELLAALGDDQTAILARIDALRSTLKKRKEEEQEVARGREIFYCPNKRCSAIIYTHHKQRWATCDECGGEACCHCLEAHGRLTPCAMADAALMVAHPRDTLCRGWKWVNTKACPECGSRIQKNGGCHHMLCRNCGTNFCWRCRYNYGKHWENSGVHCKRYWAAGGVAAAAGVGLLVVASPLLLAAAVLSTPVLIGGAAAVGTGAYVHHRNKRRRRRRRRRQRGF